VKGAPTPAPVLQSLEGERPLAPSSAARAMAGGLPTCSWHSLQLTDMPTAFDLAALPLRGLALLALPGLRVLADTAQQRTATEHQAELAAAALRVPGQVVWGEGDGELVLQLGSQAPESVDDRGPDDVWLAPCLPQLRPLLHVAGTPGCQVQLVGRRLEAEAVNALGHALGGAVAKLTAVVRSVAPQWWGTLRGGAPPCMARQELRCSTDVPSTACITQFCSQMQRPLELRVVVQSEGAHAAMQEAVPCSSGGGPVALTVQLDQAQTLGDDDEEALLLVSSALFDTLVAAGSNPALMRELAG